MEKILLKAINTGTLEKYEVLSIEIWQNRVLYVKLMDKNGDIFEVDDPEGLEYSLITEG